MGAGSSAPRTQVIVIGAGVSGLVTAYGLLAKQPDLEVQVLEASNRPGGTLGTDLESGFAFERGPNGFLDNVPRTLELARELDLGDRLLPASESAQKRFLLKNGKLIRLPHSPLQFLASPLLSLGGKVRALAEPLQARRDSSYEESVAAFARRRLGAEAAATFIDPLVTGIYAGDPDRIGLEAAFPRLFALERDHGGIFKGMIAQSRARKKAAADPAAGVGTSGPGSGVGRLHSFRGGLQELVEALSRRLGSRLRLESPVEELRIRKGEGYECLLRDRSVVRSRSVVLAVPAPRAANLVSALSPDLAISLEEIPYAPVAVICLGFRREDVAHPLDGFGFLVPRNQGLRTLGAIFVSSIFPDHAPAGTVSLRVMAGGARDPEAVGLVASELEAIVRGELGPYLGFRAEPVARKVYRYPQGIPQYNVGHAKRVRRIEGWLSRLPGLFVTGNAYRGVSVNDCVSEGARWAEEALKFLGDSRGAA